MSAGGSYVEVKREADSNDFFAEDQQSTTGMSGVLPCCIIMAALCNRGAIIYLPCDFYLSIYLLFFLA